MLRYLSVFSGIEAASEAWVPLGMVPIGVSEIDPFASAVLRIRHPDVPNFGDVCEFRSWNVGRVDIVVGGSPCQSFSTAGKRGGLEDPRGQLMLTYLDLVAHTRPRWVVWENVPGVLSSGRGRDFGAFLGALGELGYGYAYRVLDARYFGVPQRRRRVFVVGYLGDWAPAAAVLLERGCVRGDPAARSKARQDFAGAPAASAGGADENEAERGSLVVMRTTGDGYWAEGAGPLRGRTNDSHEHLVINQQAFGGNNSRGPIDVSTAMNAHGGPNGRLDFESETFIVADAIPFDTTQITSKTNRSQPRPGDPCHPVASRGHPPAVTYMVGLGSDPIHSCEVALPQTTRHGDPGVIAFTCKDYGADAGVDVAPTLRAMGHTGSHRNGGGQVAVVTTRRVVRRLTPREAERLQGFPDDHTKIPWAGKDASQCPDGRRYKAIGNSMAVPVMRWIGQRILNETARAAGDVPSPGRKVGR